MELNTRQRKRINLVYWMVAISLLLSIGLIATIVIKAEQYTEYEYQLSEIQDGIYGTYSTIVSTVPAQNCDVITLCCDGQIRTFRGTVHITYTNHRSYVLYRDVGYHNGDELWVYVPTGTIEFQGTTGVGTRR